MGDPRDFCPHLDSIGEVTKEDLLLKSKVKGQTLRPGPTPRATVPGYAVSETGSTGCPGHQLCADGKAGVCREPPSRAGSRGH